MLNKIPFNKALLNKTLTRLGLKTAPVVSTPRSMARMGLGGGALLPLAFLAFRNREKIKEFFQLHMAASRMAAA